MSGLTSEFLTSTKIVIASIKSSFEVFKSKFPNVFKNIEAIEHFREVNESEGISDFKVAFHKFEALVSVFVIRNEDDHSIKDTLQEIQREKVFIYSFIQSMDSEYNDYLDRVVNDIGKLGKIKKNAPDDVEKMEAALKCEYTRYENNMLESMNHLRVLILTKMINIENLIVKLNSNQSNNEYFF